MPSSASLGSGPFDYDVCVVGAGVVGLACGARLAEGGRKVLVVERGRTFGAETSSRNSQVLHAGMYYAPGSWKARLTVRGNPSLAAYCAARGIACERVGKLIVATAPEEEEALEGLLARGLANGSEGLVRLSRAELAARAPAVAATAALYSPRTGIVDSHAIMASLVADLKRNGGDLVFRHALVGAEPSSRGYRLSFEDEAKAGSTVAVRSVVNAAGLEADTVAALAGLDIDACGYRLRFVKGSYFRLRPRGLVPHLVYPVPPPALAGLGIHVTLDLDGALRLGPDVEVLAERRYDYAVDPARGDAFHAAVQRYLPSVTRGDLSPDQAGIRPKLARFEGAAPDFLIVEESARGLPGWVDLVGIESPGLTCCLEIAAEVAAMLS